MELLFIHSAGRQDGDAGSAPLLAALRRELGSDIHAPMMPEPGAPEATAWDQAVARHIAALSKPFVAIAHSLGGSTMLRHVALHGKPGHLAGLIAIAAPFWGMADWEVPDYALPAGFAARLAELTRLVFYHSSDDEVVDVSHLRRYGAELPWAELREVSGCGHVFSEGPAAAIAEDARSMLAAAAATRGAST